jgi:hypothetical protein
MGTGMNRRRNRATRRTAFAVGLWLAAGPPVGLADQSFRAVTVQLDHGVAAAPVDLRLADGAALLAVGEADGDWRYSVVAVADGRVVATGVLPDSAFFYDAGDALGRGTDQICLLDERGVFAIDPADGTPVVAAEFDSVYHGRPTLGPARSDFVRDVDGDGLDDILAPRFEGWLVARRAGEGFERFLPGMPPRVTVRETRISYEPRPPRLGDVDGDGRDDLVFLRDREFISFVQSSPGVFASSPRVDRIEAPLATEAQRSRWEREDGQVDQSDLAIEEVDLVRDFDGDGVLDLLTDRSISEGVFDRRSEYHLYLGRREGEALRYAAAPDGTIASDGVQFDPLAVDVDGDGRLDLATPSTRLGLARVVGALFSGRVTVDLDVYRMRADGRYPEASDHRTRFRVEFDLKTGLMRYPAVAIADLDGDGRAELILQEDADALTIFPGEDGAEGLFGPAAGKVSLPLPRNGQMVEARDLDGDGRADLLARYGPADGPERARELRLLISVAAP